MRKFGNNACTTSFSEHLFCITFASILSTVAVSFHHSIFVSQKAFGFKDFADSFADFQEVTVVISWCDEGKADGHAVVTLETWYIQDWDMKALHYC
jgi:hypothetical protein